MFKNVQPPRRQVHKRRAKNSDGRTSSSSLSPRQLQRRLSPHETEWRHPGILGGWHQTHSPHPWRPHTVSRPILLLSAALPGLRRCPDTAVLHGSQTPDWGEAEVLVQHLPHAHLKQLEQRRDQGDRPPATKIRDVAFLWNQADTNSAQFLTCSSSRPASLSTTAQYGRLLTSSGRSRKTEPGMLSRPVATLGLTSSTASQNSV